MITLATRMGQCAAYIAEKTKFTNNIVQEVISLTGATNVQDTLVRCKEVKKTEDLQEASQKKRQGLQQLVAQLKRQLGGRGPSGQGCLSQL